jgi:5-methylcytosine-specific restriction endonuclease McrA
MARYSFSLSERWAVFTTHGTPQGTKCWLCGEPLNFVEMEVDHILPEYLEANESDLKKALRAFGLPSGFELHSFENWLPAHRRCNGLKRDHVFRPTPIVQVWIDRARGKAEAARKARDACVSDRKIEQAIGVLCAGDEAAPKEFLDPIIQHYATANSERVIISEQPVDESMLRWTIPETGFIPPREVRLAPGITIIFDNVPQQNPSGPFTYKVDPSADAGESDR